MPSDEMLVELQKLALKEEFWSRAIVWLKSKGLWEECLKECGKGIIKEKVNADQAG